MRKIFICLLSIFFILNFEGCTNFKDKELKDKKNNYLALVTDLSGINDNYFNQLAWEGLKRAEKEQGFKVGYLEARSEDDYENNIKLFTNSMIDMLFCVGYEMADELRDIAELNPDKYYTMINYTFNDKYDNILCVEFEDQQAAFEEGYLSAYMTTTNKVGFIGDIKSGKMDSFECGYKAGVIKASKELDKEIYVDVNYTNSLYSESLAKEIADKMYDDGIDIIYHAIGKAGMGVIESAKNHGKYVIGSDIDQNKFAPNNVISSTIRRIDNVVYDIAKEVKESDNIGDITGKSRFLGMKEDAVGISSSTQRMISKNLVDKLNFIETEIKNDNIAPPYNKETFDEYIEMLK